MSSFNKVQLLGRLGADPEVRRAQNGDAIVSMRIATSETWRDKTSGEKRERTEWHTIVIFNQNLCKVAEQYLKKGNLVFVEGMLCTRKWQDRDGQDRYSTEVVLKAYNGELVLMPQGGEGRGRSSSPDDYGSERSRESGATNSGDSTGSGGTSGSYAEQSGGSYSRDLDDEIPF